MEGLGTGREACWVGERGCGWAPWEPDSCRAASPERDLPEPLDQKMVIWEAVQKENYLSQREKQRKGSAEEALRKTAHRCAAPPPRPGIRGGKRRPRGRGCVRLSGTRHLASRP